MVLEKDKLLQLAQDQFPNFYNERFYRKYGLTVDPKLTKNILKPKENGAYPTINLLCIDYCSYESTVKDKKPDLDICGTMRLCQVEGRILIKTKKNSFVLNFAAFTCPNNNVNVIIPENGNPRNVVHFVKEFIFFFIKFLKKQNIEPQKWNSWGINLES